MIRTHNTTTVDLIRHGEPEGGVLFRGWQDDPLSDNGWNQMRQAADGQCPWAHIITSPLLRCREFATELCEAHDIPLIVEDRFKEIGFGDWEGIKPDELYEEDPEAVGRFWSDPVSFPPPNAESLLDFQSRVSSAWKELMMKYQGDHLLVVAHGGVNRMIVGEVMGIPLSHLFRLDIPYASISRILINDGIPRLAFHCAKLSDHVS